MMGYDGIVVGAGPNGLAAAITLARAGRSVLVREAAGAVGGGVRSAELTLPGFVHDVCSAVHPLAIGSPFFASLPLASHGLVWCHSPAPLAHPFDDGTAAVLERSLWLTGETLGPDAAAYRRLMGPLVDDWGALARQFLGPPRLPRHPFATARFGLLALRSARGLAESSFRGPRARALVGGLAAHSFLPLEQPPSAAFGLVLGILGHAFGWPWPVGGAQRLADALASCLCSLGGKIVVDARVDRIEDLPPAGAVLLDVTPRQLLRLADRRLPDWYRRQLSGYRYGPGVFKMDWALDGPIPWRAPECSRAGTVHLGGTLEEIAASETAVSRGERPEQPFVLLSQPTLFDPTRAPAGKHTAWAYCHVPNSATLPAADSPDGSYESYRSYWSERIERQIERFAPGFLNRVLARHAMGPADLERHNPNLVGGDINGGRQDLRQLFTRPTPRLNPYSLPTPGLYLCSSSTPPGGGVHGMCGYHAARAALRRAPGRVEGQT